MMTADHGICDHDFRKEIKTIQNTFVLFSEIVCNIMNFYLKIKQVSLNFL